jgi:hypothetical protein
VWPACYAQWAQLRWARRIVVSGLLVVVIVSPRNLRAAVIPVPPAAWAAGKDVVLAVGNVPVGEYVGPFSASALRCTYDTP